MEFLFLSVSRGLWNAQTLQTHTQQGQEKKGSRLAPEPFQEHSEEECGKGAADRKPRGNLTLSSAGGPTLFLLLPSLRENSPISNLPIPSVCSSPGLPLAFCFLRTLSYT